jgi:hypothetical protein
MNSEKGPALFCLAMGTIILLFLITANFAMPGVNANMMKMSHGHAFFLWGFPIAAIIFGLWRIGK